MDESQGLQQAIRDPYLGSPKILPLLWMYIYVQCFSSKQYYYNFFYSVAQEGTYVKLSFTLDLYIQCFSSEQYYYNFFYSIVQEGANVNCHSKMIEIDFKFWYHFFFTFIIADICFVLSGLISTVRSLQTLSILNDLKIIIINHMTK